MKRSYKYGKPLLSKSLQRFGNPWFVFSIVIIIIFILIAIVIVDLWVQNHDEQYPTSKTLISETPTDIKFYTTSYFQFADTGIWQFEKNQSNSQMFVFQKYLGKSNIVQHRLTVYINQTPIPLYLASPRVLPVKVKNNNAFEASEVSQPCGTRYVSGELHKIKTLSMDGTNLLCDPDLTQYKVVFGKVGGNYSIKLKRANGSYATYVIIYQSLVLSPRPDTAVQIANNFQAL